MLNMLNSRGVPICTRKICGRFSALQFLLDFLFNQNMSPEQNPLTFHYTGCLIVILDPYTGFFKIPINNWVVFHPLYTAEKPGGPFFTTHMALS